MRRIAEEDLVHIFSHAKNEWEKLRHKSIFITGATGFFGKWLLESFVYINNKLSLNASITALSRNPESFLDQYPFYKQKSGIVFIKGDVQTFEFPAGQFDFIIHAATDADAALNRSNPLYMMDTITGGTRRVLEFAKLQNNLESFLFASSGAVYGQQPSDVAHIKETDSFFVDINNPASAYAEGKRVAELYCSTYFEKSNIPVKIARCFAFVGPYLPLDKHFAIGNFILNGLNKQDIIIKGDGSPYRSYLYAADLTVWLWVILLNGRNNSPYNVGSDMPLTILETAAVVCEAFHKEIKYIIKGIPTGLPAPRYVPDINNARNTLGLEINVNLNEAIKRTIEFNNV